MLWSTSLTGHQLCQTELLLTDCIAALQVRWFSFQFLMQVSNAE